MRCHPALAGVLGLAALVASPACSKPTTPPTDQAPAVTAAAAPAAAAPTAPAPAAASLAGSFRGDIAGTAATLTTQQQGDRLTGTIDAGGYAYTIDGQVRGGGATGTMKDPQTGASMRFDATLSGDDLRLALALEDGTAMQLGFRRVGAAVAAPPASPSAASRPPAPAAAPTPAPAPAATAQLDPRLIGAWHYTEQLGDPSSGTMLIRWFLDVRPDGTYTYGSDSSQQRGRWRNQGAIIEVDDGSGWAPYARYVADGNRLMFTFENGKRQLWNRR